MKTAEETAEETHTANTRKMLGERYGRVWDTTELQEDFAVEGFAAPCVVVTRKSDGQRGSLEFTHHPRFYFDFQAHKGR